MDNFSRNPLKLYIQDIFRANRTTQNKYIYEIFGVTFKNIMIHGVVTAVTAVSNSSKGAINLELSDPTGTVHIYYDKTKNNLTLKDESMKSLHRDFIEASKFGDSNIEIINNLMERIRNKKKQEIKEGMYLLVIGDIFVDDTRNVRMVSAYECSETSVERDIIWMEELRYLYDKFYLQRTNKP